MTITDLELTMCLREASLDEIVITLSVSDTV